MTNLAAFLWALSIIFRLEGGWYDGDGGTNYGIRAITLRSANNAGIVSERNIRKITRRDAAQIYYQMYWLRSGAHRLGFPLNLVHFDAAVHAGPDKARQFLNSAFRGASNPLNSKSVALQYVSERWKHLRSLPKFRSRPGWRTRMKIILDYVLKNDTNRRRKI